MKKIVVLLTIALALMASLVIVKQIGQSTSATYTIGILQTASHPALDAARDGFVEELKNKLGSSVAFVIQNAQGSVANAHALAQQFHANKRLSGFFAIATPAAQAMTTVEKERPIMIAAVTDPVALGLIHPTTNVCGTKDMIDVPSEIEMLIALVPQAHHIGLLYTSGELNSIALVTKMRQELQKRGLKATDFAFGSETDVQAMVALACRKTDLLLAPTDNMVASTISVIATTALASKKPLIVSDTMLVRSGPLAARGVDYKASGKRAAQIAFQVLVGGKKPGDIPIEQAESSELFINQSTLRALGLSVPDSLKKLVTFVEE
jgi:putative tryptophan/tyrosine transport system substrate-binding protein